MELFHPYKWHYQWVIGANFTSWHRFPTHVPVVSTTAASNVSVGTSSVKTLTAQNVSRGKSLGKNSGSEMTWRH